MALITGSHNFKAGLEKFDAPSFPVLYWLLYENNINKT